MFSAEYYQEIKKGFERQMNLLEERICQLKNEEESKKEGLGGVRIPFLQEKRAEILRTLEECNEEEKEALVFLYSAMPVSDLLDYPAALFLTYAKHGVFLWHQGPFAGKIPERIFANYVLHYRVNNEDIVDTRGFFYDKVIDRVAGKGMKEAALEVNYWCAEEGTYRSTDGRTQNARTFYSTATGRCGEESTFAVTVLRSVGIPARQIYAPLWTHCDDNHAWVEAMLDGEWHFLGACEPEERLDLGWFIDPASRAMLLHSRFFGPFDPLDPIVGRKGMCRVLNHLGRYAHTTTLTIRVVDEDGKPVPGAKVDCQLLNHGAFGNIALVNAGTEGEDCGVVRLLTGYGDLLVCASANGCYGETHVSLVNLKEGEEAECVVTLKSAPECQDDWMDLDFHAPALGFINDSTLTEEQKRVGAARNQEAAEHREKKKKGFYDAREAARVLGRFGKEDKEALDEILHKAHSNITEVIRFLEWDASGLLPGSWEAGKTEHWKLDVLCALREKDLWDMKADILKECCINALPYAGSVPDEMFYRFVVNPRVENEMVRLCRTVLNQNLSDDEKDAIRKNPEVLPALVDQWILSMPGQEYESMVTSPIGCLRGGIGSRHSKDIFCVTIYRTLGIPARFRMLDHKIEIYRDGSFELVEAPAEKPGTLILSGSETIRLADWEHYSLERFNGDHYSRVGLWGHLFGLEGDELKIDLEPGIYRILTTNRQASGDQLARVWVFSLESGETKKIALSMREVSAETMMTKTEVEDFAVKTLDGEEKTLSELTGDGKALFLWLAVTREPTEHILNELYERCEDYAALGTPLYVVLRTPEDLEDKTLKRAMGVVPNLCPLVSDFGDSYEKLAESVHQEVGKLPLALVLNGGTECLYSNSGYNVGLADILWRILTA